MRRQVIFFKSHQRLEADYVAVKYNANTWVQGSTVQIFIPRSLVHSQPFFNIGLELSGSICNGYRRLLQLNPSEGGSTYHASLGVSFDRPAITSGKKIVKEDC